MYKCNTGCVCPNVLVANSVSESGGSFFFVTANTITPMNGKRYTLKCPVSLLPTTESTTVSQVYVTLNGNNIPLQCKLGNNVYSDQIKCFNTDCCNNIVLRLAYGSTPSHFKIISQDLCCSLAYGTTANTINPTNSTRSTTVKKTVSE